MSKIVTYIVLFTFTSLVVSSPAWAVDVGTCRAAKGAKNREQAPHIFFPQAVGRLMLTEIKVLRLQTTEKKKLIDTKLELKDEIAEWYKTQITTIDKTMEKISKELVVLRTENHNLLKVNNDLTIQVAKEKGEKYKVMVWGFVIGFSLAALLGLGFGIAIALK